MDFGNSDGLVDFKSFDDLRARYAVDKCPWWFVRSTRYCHTDTHGRCVCSNIGLRLSGGGFPINSRPGALHGWYTFTSDTGDAFSGTLAVVKNGQPLGSGIYYSATPHSVYSEFVVNLLYLTGDVPDTAIIFISIANSPRTHVGSTFTVDDLSFGSATGVDEPGIAKPNSYALEQNYPNPFNPSTRIQFQIPEAGFVTLKVYNLLGQEVATLVNEQMREGRYRAVFDAGDLPSGTYMYRLSVVPPAGGGFVQARKLLLLK